MQTLKQHLALSWILILALLLAACAPAAAPAAAPGDTAAEEETSSEENFEWVTPDRVGDPNAPMEISILLEPTYSHQTSIEARYNYLSEAYEAWTRANPDVQLTFQPYVAGQTQQNHARLLELASSGRAPDIAMIDGQLVPLFFDYLQPLDDYVPEEELADWFDWAREGGMIDPEDGSLKTLWFTTNTVGLWYRQDLIPEPPTTWAEFLDVAQQMKEEEGFQYGFVTQGYQEQIPYGLTVPYFYALGGELVDENGMPVFGEEEYRGALVETLSFWDEAVKSGATDTIILDITSSSDQIAEVAADSAAMVVGGSWLLPGMSDVTDMENWDFALLPQKEGVEPVQVVGGWTWGVFTDDPEKQAEAIDFIMTVYAGSEGMAGWCEAGGYSPTRQSIYEDYAVFSDDRFQQKFSEAISYGRTRPGVQTYSIISEAIQNAFQEVVLGLATPEEAVQTAWDFVQLETQ